MALFLGVLALGDYAPRSYALGIRSAAMLAPGVFFLFFAFEKAYPELRGYKAGGAIADVLAGLVIAAIWVAPYLFWPGLRPGPGEAFDPSAAGESNRHLALALRFVGYVLVTPFIEELLVRSYIIRIAEVYDDQDPDFRKIPIGRFAWKGFIVTVVWFTFTHVQWEWPVAFATGVLYNLWLYRRKHIGATILSHAVTNGAIFLLALERPELMFFL